MLLRITQNHKCVCGSVCCSAAQPAHPRSFPNPHGNQEPHKRAATRATWFIKIPGSLFFPASVRCTTSTCIFFNGLVLVYSSCTKSCEKCALLGLSLACRFCVSDRFPTEFHRLICIRHVHRVFLFLARCCLERLGLLEHCQIVQSLKHNSVCNLATRLVLPFIL
jgi:hypothetical protein